MAVGGRRMRAVALVASAVLGAAVPVPASAHPRESGLLQCQGTESVTYRPGVTFRPQRIRVTVDGRFGSCAGGGGGAAVKSGGYHEEFTVFAGCNNLLEGFRARRTYSWNTGDTSTAEIAGSTTAVAGQVVTPVTGTVTHGRFQGRTLLQVIPLPQPGALQCLSGGLTGATGVTTLTIT
ncbi:hypothetical protein [Streptomyces griseocarneus]|uniref:hypothetical protein n=1 Tax=Streptomyces griseocarneus TaxID=51201 RepID=UPI00167C808E|nr:hypothetical protein [Streptomyces griseocarneus]MBZ6475431.1 hypothetical protein [Streptomyces griseocarneus]GHG75200.1 hypothetical protein GCM10018779_52640 [Streptomyces griseocarneus]